MKKQLTLIAIFVLVSIISQAQFSTDWMRPAGSTQKTGVMIARDNQDNVIATGYWVSNNTYTRKYNKFGVLQWEAISASGIASNYERPLWVTTDNSNNVFVAGYRYSGTSTPNAVVVLKYSPDGDQLWKQVISPINFLAGMNLRCEVDNNGNLYVGACGVGTLPGFALIKFDTNGNILFTQNSAVNAPGLFRSMRLKGNKIVLSASSAAGGNPSVAQIAVWDTTGNLLWTAGLLGRGGHDVEIDDAANVYLLTGYDNQVTPSSAMDIVIYKFDPSGTQLWKKDFDFGGSDFPTRLTFAADKLSVIGYGTIAASYFDWLTFQINTAGAMLWNTRYNETSGNDEEPYFIAAKANGDVFVTGKGGPMFTQFGSQYLRMITVKYDNTGLRKWVDSTNIYSGWGYACTLASDNSLYVLSGTSMTAFHFLDHTGAGPCNIPTGATVTNITNTFASFSWTAVPNATLYHVRYKPVSSSTWNVVSYNLTSINIFGLYPGTTYEYAVEAICDNGPTGYGATQTFTTTGTAMCTSAGQSQTQEYLAQVWLLNGFNNYSGNNNGYADFTNIVAPLNRNQLVQGYLSGLVPYPEYEYYGIWIDYNHDNDFNDPGEDVVALYTDFTGLISFNFTVPSNAPLGTARMRIVMSHDSPATPCGNYTRGETEDYTVLINDNSTVPPPVPTGLIVFNITNSSGTFSWTPDATASSYNLRYKKLTENTWTVAPVNTTSITIPGLSANTDYDYACEAVGSVGRSGYSATQAFTTIGGPLPINGIQLKASRQQTNVLVSWSTQSEQNSAYFEVQKSSDGLAFFTIGRVQAAGNSSGVRNYSYHDLNVENCLIYYRLKVVDVDAAFSISLIKIVPKIAGLQEFSLFPNPATINANLVLNEPASGEMQLQIINQLGQVVLSKPIFKGIQFIKLDLYTLSSGIYAVRLTAPGINWVNKLVIK